MTLQGGMSTALGIHLVPLLTASGLDRAEAASIIALMGAAALTGQLATGWLADRVTSTLLPVACLALPAVAYALLLQGAGSIPLLAVAVLVAGYATSATVTMTTYLTSRYGGVRSFGSIYGVITSGMGLGAGLMPLVAGRIYDTTGSYHAFLLLGVGLAVVNALLVFRLGPYPKFEPQPS